MVKATLQSVLGIAAIVTMVNLCPLTFIVLASLVFTGLFIAKVTQ